MGRMDHNPHRPEVVQRTIPYRQQTPAMRLIARALIVLTAVLGISLTFAWAWDRSDPPAVEAH
jgi:cell division septal protein FtsQ